MYKIVFSDADGTLLNSAHQVTPRTREALLALPIPFVIVSGRYPRGIVESIMQKNGFHGPVISCGGALLLDADGAVLYENGMSPAQAAAVTAAVDAMPFDVTWNVFSLRDWLVREVEHPRVRAEERLLGVPAAQGSAAELPAGRQVHKVLCMCNAADTARVEEYLRVRFPQLTVVRSAATLVEVMNGGVNKALALERLCWMLGVSPQEAIAFGDNYNDLEMLRAVGCPVVMGNAPAEIRAQFSRVTADNDHDGIAEILPSLLGE